MANDGLFQDDPAEAVAALESRVLIKKMLGPAGPEAYEVHPVDASAGGLVAFAVQGLRALGYADPFWEWQWVTRDKNMTPKR